MKEFVIGDIHSNIEGLKTVLRKANFNYSMDKLICLGDYCDKLVDAPLVLEELLKIKNLTYVMGNHDVCVRDFLIDRIFSITEKNERDSWLYLGGDLTYENYHKNYSYLITPHVSFLKKCKFYHIDDSNRLFIHAGIDTNKDITQNTENYLCTSRELWKNMQSGLYGPIDIYNEVYIGHTPTLKSSHSNTKPMTIHNLTNMDTGSGNQNGKLSLMNINSKELFQD